jgi:hypothetical protein
MITLSYTRHGKRFDHLTFTSVKVMGKFFLTLQEMGATQIRIDWQ